MTLIDRVAPPAATTEVAPPPLAVPASDRRADARIRSVLTALDAVVGRLATDPTTDGITVDGRPVADPIGEATELDEVNDVARAILRAAISRGHEELGTIRALPIRRTAWVRAHQAQLVIDRLLPPVGGQDEPGPAAWQRHLVVIEHAEQGLRLVKTAIGDSTVAPDAELAGYEHGLQVLARLRPATPAVWDQLYAHVVPADETRS